VVEMLLKVTEPDEGLTGGGWTASEVQERVQAKLRAMSGGGGGGGSKVDSKDGSKYGSKGAVEGDNNSGGKGKQGGGGGAYKPVGVTDAMVSEMHKRAGDEAFIKGDYASADVAYTSSLTLGDDTNAKVWSNRAAARLKLKDNRGALADAITARQIDGGYVKAWFREGCALTELKDFEGAAVAFFEGLQVDGDNKDLKGGFDAAIAKGREAHLKTTK